MPSKEQWITQSDNERKSCELDLQDAVSSLCFFVAYRSIADKNARCKEERCRTAEQPDVYVKFCIIRPESRRDYENLNTAVTEKSGDEEQEANAKFSSIV